MRLPRAIETGAPAGWLLAGALIGFAFLTKMLQALLIVPGLALVFLLAGAAALRTRIRATADAGAGAWSCPPAGGWRSSQLVPASGPAVHRRLAGRQRSANSMFGYNGFGRLTGNETGSVGGGGAPGGGGAGVGGALGTGAAKAAGAATGRGPGAGGAGGMWGSTGLGRLFGTDVGGQIAWLLPAALVLLLFGLWATRRYARTDSARAAFLVWGGFLLCTGLTFSYMGGIFHQYYTVALAPAIAALTGMGVDGLWRARRRLPYALLLGAVVAGTGWWAFVLLGRSAGFVPWLRWAVLVGGVLAAAAVPAGGRLTGRAGRRLAAVTGVAALAVGLGGPAAYALDTVSTAHTGSIVTAGPNVQGAGGPGGRGGPGGMPGGMRGGAGRGAARGAGGAPGSGGGAMGGWPGAGAQGGAPGGLPGSAPGTGGASGGAPAGPGGGGGGMGGLLEAQGQRAGERAAQAGRSRLHLGRRHGRLRRTRPATNSRSAHR